MLSSVSESRYQRALRARAAELHPALQAYFAMPPAGLLGRGAGVYEVAGSRLRRARPLWAWLARRHVRFPELGRDIPFTVFNHSVQPQCSTTVFNTPTSEGDSTPCAPSHSPVAEPATCASWKTPCRSSMATCTIG